MLAIGAFIIAIWFYLSAKRAQKNPFLWVAIGVISYYVISVFWLYGILKPVLGHSFSIHRMGAGVVIKGSGLVIGLLMAALVRNKFLHSADQSIKTKGINKIDNL